MNDEEFDRMCRRALGMGYVAMSAVFPEKSKEVLDELAEYTANGTDAAEVLTKFLLVSVTADGVLSLEEFMLLRPYFIHMAGKSVEYDDALWMFIDMGLDNIENFKGAMTRMSEVYSSLPEELRLKIINLCLMVIAADGKISEGEKVWVKELCMPDPKFDADLTIQKIRECSKPSRLY